jgi:hypothetical protein
MRTGCIAPTGNVGQHDPRPNDVRYGSADLRDSFANDFKAANRLPIDVAWRRGISCRPYRCSSPQQQRIGQLVRRG